MGDLFKTKKAPPPPDITPPQTFIDSINGVQVESKDGKTTISQTALSPEMKANQDRLDSILKGISDLSEGLAIDNPTYAPMIDSLRKQQAKIRGTAFSEINRASEDELARRGLSNSTSASNDRMARDNQFQTAVQTDENNLATTAEGLRADDLNRRYSLLNADSGLQTQRQQTATQAGYQLLGGQQSAYSQDNAITLGNYNAQLQAFNSAKPSTGSQLLNAGVTLGAAYLTGGASLAVTGLPGSSSTFGGGGTGMFSGSSPMSASQSAAAGINWNKK